MVESSGREMRMVSEAQERVPTKYKKKRADAVTFSFDTMNEQTMKTAQSIAKEENYSVVNCCLSRNFIP